MSTDSRCTIWAMRFPAFPRKCHWRPPAFAICSEWERSAGPGPHRHPAWEKKAHSGLNSTYRDRLVDSVSVSRESGTVPSKPGIMGVDCSETRSAIHFRIEEWPIATHQRIWRSRGASPEGPWPSSASPESSGDAWIGRLCGAERRPIPDRNGRSPAIRCCADSHRRRQDARHAFRSSVGPL